MLEPRLRILLLGALGAVAVAWAACADNAEAPPASAPTSPVCRSFTALMPRFETAISSGQTEGLRQVVQNYLLVPDRSGEPAPAVDVLRALLGTLAGFAAYPPEPGAAPGQDCAYPPDGGGPFDPPVPPVSQASPLCETRRAMDSLVHNGKALGALQQLDPLLSGFLDYVTGQLPSSATPHYELAGVISGMCQQSAICQTDDALDLVVGLTTFLQTPQGAQLLADGNALVNNPALQPYLTNSGQQFGGEDGVVALAQILIQTIGGMDDPSALDSLPLSALPAALQPDLQALVADLKLLLDPSQGVLGPTKKVINCYSTFDTDSDLVRMVYRLAFDAQLPAFQFQNILGAVQALQATDQRGTLLFLVRVLSQGLRDDTTAGNSLGDVCSTLFSNQIPPGATQSNAALALPSIDALVTPAIGEQLVCAVDTLIYGCAGGSQPACVSGP
jgi:hypothetical protein